MFGCGGRPWWCLGRRPLRHLAPTSPRTVAPSSLIISTTMGKAKKAKKPATRFDPMARPATAAASADDDIPMDEPKQLSAHQQRHLERKRLQAEKIELKQKKNKVSKADKNAWKEEKKQLSLQQKQNRAALKGASSRLGLPAAPPAEPEPPPQPAFAGFDLPVTAPVAIDPAFAVAAKPQQQKRAGHGGSALEEWFAAQQRQQQESQ